MKFAPRPFQKAGIDHAVNFLLNATSNQRQPYAAPTGVGKSVVELAVQHELNSRGQRCWLVTPREEIVDGLLDKLQVPDGADPLDHFISTPIRLRNRLLDGRIPPPTHIIFDEAHHHNAETWQQLDLLTGLCPAICYTATPYRGNPKGTREWTERWGNPIWLITFEEACREGFIALPTFDILPLVDDDVVEIGTSGEFNVTSIDSNTVDRLGDLAEHCRKFHDGQTWDRMTVFALPSSATCIRLRQELHARGLPVAIMSADTPRPERRAIFQACRERLLALLQIDIVSEGVDEPFRRLIDVAPTMSPVKWVQKLGRITRPTQERPPEYICTNRNILRHAYALDGCVPVSAIAAAERVFAPSERSAVRVLGTEVLGRFQPANVKMLDGTTTQVYCVSTMQGNQVVQYACLIRPHTDPVWCKTQHEVREDRSRIWGNWQLLNEPPSSIRGFSSIPGKPPTEKQMAWWNRSAQYFGIDSTMEPTKKTFAILPILKDIGGWPRG